MASCCVVLRIQYWMMDKMGCPKMEIKSEKLTELVIRVITPPVTLFRIAPGKPTGGMAKDVDVTTAYEHGWKDGNHFKWMVPDGRYWAIQGLPGASDPMLCSIVVDGGKITKKQMNDFDLKKWRAEQSRDEPDAKPVVNKPDVKPIVHKKR